MSAQLRPLAKQPVHSLRSRAHRAWLLAEGDHFLAQYFQRIDLKVAATFTPEQRTALKQMFGDLNKGNHLVDFRHSLPIGRKRFYLVVLFGHERRELDRLRAEGVVSRSTTIFIYLLTLLILAVPLVGLFYMLKTAAGIELPVDGSAAGFLDGLRAQIATLFGGG
ncbi:hypothetical protein SAMN06265365_12297 [Tistlia consotensis]|uniref:Uncharacterized protein n=1 Tax=Tistlia consotensis USBA 355 TaxID=560819 RepID=A0A1Y6CLY0_9PROT|nr:hypothetical protein [Tistlia consotensis]SMF63331.1 hypothetical protein SAMN05428998_12497 [Tistlia consotensis USBA 355]SNR96038.1 hypothetical protein SAMN06265365_12297 [Tistlia consotensis]